MDYTVLVSDTETASLQGGICDLAIVEIDNDFNVIREMESLVDPERPISPQASGIHHITDDMVADEPTLSEIMDIWGHPFQTEKPLMIAGHNIQFDVRMLSAVLPEQLTKLCTLKLAKNLWPDAEDHKLQTLRYKFKLDAGTAHRALGDVMACVSLLRMVGEMHDTDLMGVFELARKPLSLDSKFPFGKHKGVKLKDIPLTYVSWALKEMKDLDPDLREALAGRIR